MNSAQRHQGAKKELLMNVDQTNTPVQRAALIVLFGICSVSLAAPPTVDQILAGKFERVLGNKTGGAAIFPPKNSKWCDQFLSSPTVHFDGKIYRCWFVGSAMTKDPGIPYGWSERVGLATSRDGLNWTIANGGKPVLDFGRKTKFDDCGISHPFVLKVGKLFYMWYGGIDGRSAADINERPRHVRIEQIGLAVSKDGIKWRRANGGRPVMFTGEKGSIDTIQATGHHIIRLNGRFIMWYGAYNGKHTLGIATSPDGIHWTKQNGGMSLPGLHGPKQLGPSVYHDGRKFLMLYNTTVKTPNGGSIWTLFMATSRDGINWKQAKNNQQVLGPAPPGNFGSADGKKGNNHCVHPTKFVVLKDRIRVWYGAEGNKAPPGKKYALSGVGLMELRFGK